MGKRKRKSKAKKENPTDMCVTLVIQNKKILCNKEELSEHSEYFRAMFAGNFIESYKDTIKINDVLFKPFSTILELIRNPNRNIKGVNHLQSVLEMSVMLQFNAIKELLLPKVAVEPTAHNCINLWQTMEFLGFKTKALEYEKYSLLHFEDVKNTDQILLFDLKQLHNYLANIKLYCKREYHVFQTCMKWWNSQDTSSLDKDRFLLCFLSCLDFRELTVSDISAMIQSLNLSDDHEIFEALKIIIAIKNGELLKTMDVTNKLVTKWCNSGSRNSQSLFCMLLPTGGGKPFHDHNSDTNNKRPKLEEKKNNEIDFVYCDDLQNKFIPFARVENFRCDGVSGFKVVTYLEKIYMLGGECGIGSRRWNNEVWVYNCIFRKWKYISKMPYARRHFLAVATDKYIYVIGGTGDYRVQQYNMFWYDIEENSWSAFVNLPVNTYLKGGYCNEGLVLIDISTMIMYTFSHDSQNWTTVYIELPATIPVPLVGNYEVVTFSDVIYLRGKYLIKMNLCNGGIEVVEAKQVENSGMHSILTVTCTSSSAIYSISVKHLADSLILEKYCTKTKECKTRFNIKCMGGRHFTFYSHAFAFHDIFTNDKGVINTVDFSML